jgi:UDP-N-acetylmuramoyl-tripeptide--D-alanyl-D-alanine ligase
MNISALHQVFLTCKSVCTDTREIKSGVIFFALKGPNFNGNNYAQDALNKGALAVVIDEDSISLNNNVFRVDNVLHCLQQLANYHRLQYNIPIIAITGTNGKTTTKELLHAGLSTTKNVLSTQGNLNNHIGVPLTLLNLKSQHDVAIIEMGANKPGDIAELCQIANPTHGLITNVGKAHLEGFGSFEGVIKTKTELYQYLAVQIGVLFYRSGDDILTSKIPKKTTNISYAIGNNNAQYNFENAGSNEFASITYVNTTIKSNLIGDYNNLNIAAATAISLTLQCPIDKIKEGIEAYQPTNNRSELKHVGTNSIIWDAYNANPSSMELALQNLYNLKSTKQKIVILGDMNELGEHSTFEHQNLIAQTKRLGFKTYFVGPKFEEQQKPVNHFKSADLLNTYFQQNPIDNAVILIKGSRSIQLEKLKEYFN